MTKPSLPYLLFHPNFIAKFGNSFWNYGSWDFRQVRKSYEKRWWEEGCFAIDAEMRFFPLKYVQNRGPALIVANIFQPRDLVFLSTKHVFSESFEQLTFEEARDIYVRRVSKNRWWSATNETERQFRARHEKYSTWDELIEKVSLAGRGP